MPGLGRRFDLIQQPGRKGELGHQRPWQESWEVLETKAEWDARVVAATVATDVAITWGSGHYYAPPAFGNIQFYC